MIKTWCPGDVALYVTDKFREIFFSRYGADAAVDGQAIIDRLAFIERQCPE